MLATARKNDIPCRQASNQAIRLFAASWIDLASPRPLFSGPSASIGHPDGLASSRYVRFWETDLPGAFADQFCPVTPSTDRNPSIAPAIDYNCASECSEFQP
jgi:hypothetical protein